MDLAITTRFPLNDGRAIPALGLGVFQIPAGRATRVAVGEALAAGYRLVDTARLYGNERDVGAAVRESGLPRDDVFVTTKLWNSDHGYERALRAFEASRAALGLDYVDLYLIHWPVPGLRADSWKALVKLRDSGLCRSIGVSNYTVDHLEELLRTSDVVPAVDQVEFSPFLFQRDLLDYCVRHGIVLEAYSPLTKGARLRDPLLREMAAKYARTPAQVLLRWALQHGVVVIPKSARPERIRENARLFDFSISAKDMAVLDGLGEGYRTSWNPEGQP
ncbi:MAG: aldo/keto reductase [Methanobacteriota archaeon]